MNDLPKESRSAWKITIIPFPARISSRSAPQITRKSSGLTVGADNIRPQNVPLSAIGKIAEQGILQMANHYENVIVDKYCVMPDHLHMILSINTDKDGRQTAAPTLRNNTAML